MRGPTRRAIRADSIDPATKPTPNATNTSPVASGPKPSPSCSVTVRHMKNADNPLKNATATTSPSENPGSRNSRMLTSGARPRCCSASSNSTNSAKAGSDSASPAQAQAGQPASRPSTSG